MASPLPDRSPSTPRSLASIPTPDGAGSDDDGLAPSTKVTITLCMMSGEVLHRGDYAMSNLDTWSIGDFIEIAKQSLNVNEDRIALAIGDDDKKPFTTKWNDFVIWQFKVVQDFIRSNPGYLNITVIQLPNPANSEAAM